MLKVCFDCMYDAFEGFTARPCNNCTHYSYNGKQGKDMWKPNDTCLEDMKRILEENEVPVIIASTIYGIWIDNGESYDSNWSQYMGYYCNLSEAVDQAAKIAHDIEKNDPTILDQIYVYKRTTNGAWKVCVDELPFGTFPVKYTTIKRWIGPNRIVMDDEEEEDE